MPPKAKILKEEIVTKAFDILRKEGFQAITARRLSKELNCSTQPIYYIFRNMGDLKRELYVKGVAFFEQYVGTLKQESQKEADFLELGVAYIKGAKLEQKLFHFICMENNYGMEGVSQLVSGASLPQKESQLFLHLWIYAHGIACIVANNDVPFEEDELRNLLLQAYLGFQAVVQGEKKD